LQELKIVVSLRRIISDNFPMQVGQPFLCPAIPLLEWGCKSTTI